MNFALIIGLVLLMGSPVLWARGTGLVRIDSIISSSISTDELQKIPTDQRNLGVIYNLQPSFSDTRLFQEDVMGAQDKLRDNLKYFSDSSNRQPSNLDSAIKEYFAHAPQNTQQMITQLDTLKANPGSFGEYNFSGFNTPRQWSVYPQELPNQLAFTPREQIWGKQNLPFGRLGITKDPQGWGYGLSTYDRGKWDWSSGYRLGESFGINGPIIAYGKSPQGPELSFFASNGNFVGDVTQAKLKIDPYVTAKYLLQADHPSLFGPSQSYDRSVAVGDFQPQGVIVVPYGHSLGDDFQTAGILNAHLAYDRDYYAQEEDCDDYEYYYYHEEECEEFYEDCDPPYDDEPIFARSILGDSKNPNDPLYPNLKPKKKSGGGGFMSGLISAFAPVPVTLSQDDSSDLNVKDQYSLPQIGFSDKSDPNSAWNAVDTKGPNILVAVIDSGLDLTHPDSPEFIWQNPVDGTHGWNFLDENSDLRDFRGHGTMVAGIIAARTNNDTGMAGINAGAVIMPLKVTDKNGNTNSLNIYRAIHYAVDHGARVINISLGALGVSKLENLAINYARVHNVLVVIASGNSRNDIGISGPSSSGSAVAVGALNYDGTLATVSNWGANNSLMTPGEQIFSLHSKDARWDGPAGMKDRLYTKESGTSFSAPMVAATASLLLVKNPNLTADQLEDLLLSSAKPLDGNRWSGLTGAGLLDAASALRANPQDSFNIKITKLKTVYKYKKLQYVDVYATVRGMVDYFTVDVGRGKDAHGFRPIIGISAQEASDDLVAHIPENKLRGSYDWVIRVQAYDKSGKEYDADTALTIK